MTSFYTSVERYGNNILYIGYEGNRRIKKQIPFEPELYVLTKNKSKYRTLDGKIVDVVKPGSMRDAKEFIERNEADNWPIYGQLDYVLQFINDKFPDGVEFDSAVVNITTIDIETAYGSGIDDVLAGNTEITAITMKNNIDDIFYTWGYGDYDPAVTEVEDLKDKKIKYVKCKNETELLRLFVDRWEHNTPDIVTGWNSELFDIPVLIHRIANLFGEEPLKRLSPWRHAPRQIDAGGKVAYHINGVIQYDYLKIFKKFALKYGNQESYSLDHIGHVVLGKKKLDYSEYDNLEHLREENHQKFIDYNIRDVDLVEQIETQEGFISVALTIAYKANGTLASVFGTVGVWDAFIFNYLKKKNIIIPPKSMHHGDIEFEGGYVKDPQVGMHEWVVSFDLNSLYPHLIMQYNMSPETIVDEVMPGVKIDDVLNGKTYPVPEHLSMAATGQMFSKKQYGWIPQIIDDMYAERAETKNKMLSLIAESQGVTDNLEKARYKKLIKNLDNSQHSIKILMNSLYGAMSNKWFRYFDLRIPRAITISGQLTIRLSAQAVNNKLNSVLKNNKDYIIASDTDSIYVGMSDILKASGIDLSDKDKVCDYLTKISDKQLVPTLNKAYEKLASNFNAYGQRMNMKQEVIADKAVWTGKKRYFANVLDDEGVRLAKPKVKVVGIESKRSSTPEVCRNLIDKTMKLIISSDEDSVQKFIAEARKNFRNLPIEDISFPRGVNDIEKWKDSASLYKSGTPIQVRAALLYNKMVDQQRINNKYDHVASGDKIKYTYLKKPNPLQENVIGFINRFPVEFGLSEFVDYDMQFDKSYMEPIRTILNAIDWREEKQNTLEDFFG
jgi:DNA polymerase elongation subunit (family B)